MVTATKRDIYALARELSQALAESPVLLAHHASEDALFADPEAMALIDAFEKSKKVVKAAMPRGTEAVEKALRHQMDLQDQMDRHPLIGAYKANRDELNKLIENLNAIITFPIYGDDPAPKKSGCGSSGGCGSGGG